MEKRKTRKTSHPKIDGETKTRKLYNFRHRGQRANYQEEPSDPEIDSYIYDSDNSRDMPLRSTRRRNTTLSTPRELDTGKVNSRVESGEDHGQGGNTTSCALRALETEMAGSDRDLVTENTNLSTPREKGNTTLSTPRELDTEKVNSKVESGEGHGQGGNTTSCALRASETEMAGSDKDLVTENTNLSTPREKGNTTLSTPRELDTEKVNSRVESGEDHGQGGNTTSCALRASETEMAGLDRDLVTENTNLSTPREKGNTTLSTPRELDTEKVNSRVESGEDHGQGGNTTSCALRASETEMAGSDRDLVTENTNLSTPTEKGNKLADSSVDSIARRTRGPGKGVISTAAETATSARRRGRGRGRRSSRLSECGAGRGGESIGWGTRGTRSRTSQRRAVDGEQNDEISNPRQSLTMEKSPSSIEGQSVSMQRPSTERMRLSCKKTILSWLIDYKLVDEGEQVYYMDDSKERITMTGRITRGGVICTCCQRETSVYNFEKHAGSYLRKPYDHIYLPGKATCLQHCQIAAWQNATERKRRTMFSYVPKKNASDQNGGACSICGDGGDLICCEKCPSTYHPSCMNMEMVPHTDWLCPYCICKYCGIGAESKAFITCCQCEKKFHWGCFKDLEKDFSREALDPNCSRLFCGPGCREIYDKLEGSLGIRNDISASYSWRVVRQIDMTPGVVPAARNLHIVENNSKVAVAWMLMSEAFEMITDRCTGINVVQSIVYSCGSNLNMINFSRFYNFVLEKDDEIIAAACIRIHGRGIAEMPFIATDEAYRGQGNCRSLMRVIESFLCSLKVENLIIPSILDTAGMWKRKFGFNVVNKELKRAITSTNILMIPRAIRLYKDLSKGIPDGGHGGVNEHNQTDIQDGPEPQPVQVERPLQTDIQNGPEPQPVHSERSLQTDIRNGPEPQPAQAERPPQTDIQNGPEPQPLQEVRAERPLETDIQNDPEPQPMQVENPLQTDIWSGPEPQPLQEMQAEIPLQTDNQNGPEPQPMQVESPFQTDIRNGPEPQPAQAERPPQTDIWNGSEPQPSQEVQTEKPLQTDIQNGLEPQPVQAERPFLGIDLNMPPREEDE